MRVLDGDEDHTAAAHRADLGCGVDQATPADQRPLRVCLNRGPGGEPGLRETTPGGGRGKDAGSDLHRANGLGGGDTGERHGEDPAEGGSAENSAGDAVGGATGSGRATVGRRAAYQPTGGVRSEIRPSWYLGRETPWG
jgi:hypothetical protein